jgi:hypothetical protein
MICQQHLPFIADRVIQLRLYGYDDGSQQINLFLSYIPSLDQFTHVRLLTLSNLQSYETLLKLLDKCHYLNSLTHLNFFSCSCSNRDADFQLIVDKIWSLAKLTHCNFGIDIGEGAIFCLPTIISSTLEYLTIFFNSLELNQLNQLFDYTPRLKDLSVNVQSIIDDDYIVSPLPTLSKFCISFSLDFVTTEIDIFVQSMPNLRYLHVLLFSELIDGHQWEQIIRDNLPKLKIFKIYMGEEFPFDENIKERAERLSDTFQSSFWTDEHQWFVRCFTQNKTIYLQSLSSRSWNVMFPDFWQSTYPYDDQQDFYNKMTTISDELFFNQPLPSHIRLPNIEELSIKLPITDQFWSIIPSLNQLYSLTVSCYTDAFQSQLQTLLDRAPDLYSLTISQDTSLSLQMSLFNCSNASIRELDLDECEHCFNEEECLTLSRSPLGVQCEVLYIRVDRRECIINLTKNILNLRSLIVKCADDEYYEQSTLTKTSDDEYHNKENLINDKLVQWLKDHLSPTYSIVRDLEADNILIWI